MADETALALAAVQFAGHKEIDAIYAPLSREVEQTILRHATPDDRGILRLSLPSRAAILTAIGGLIDNARLLLMRAIVGAVRAAETAAMAGAAMVRDLTAGLTAMGTIWRALGTNRPSVIGQTGALLVRGIAAGQTAKQVAGTVRQFFSPWFSQYRDAAGRLLHTERLGAIRSWPGRAGQASAHARLVLLTETTAAHGRVQTRLALANDQLLRYTVSRGHSEVDECTDLANADSGFGPGVYEPRDAPHIPRHPRCRCTYSRMDRPARQRVAA